MTRSLIEPQGPPAEDLETMHALYRQLGKDRQMVPHIVYGDTTRSAPACSSFASEPVAFARATMKSFGAMARAESTT